MSVGDSAPRVFPLIASSTRRKESFPLTQLSRHNLECQKAQLMQERELLTADEQHLLAALLRLRQEAESFQEELGRVEARINIIQEDLAAIDASLEKRD